MADNSIGDQWFKYTVTQRNVNLKISTCGLTNADTYVEVYKGDCTELNSGLSRYEGCGQQSHVTIAADSGVTYYIVWKDNYTVSSYLWKLKEVPQTGTNCQNAIAAVAGTNTGDNK